ncbi:gamma-glutamyltranspeptidase [Salmonella bongori]|nr:gamma-glutamyltranspeptidase [Salmonella bongori]
MISRQNPACPNVYGLVGGDANAIGPGKRPLSSMSPTIVVKEGKTWLVTGSPGGSRIITTVLQMVVNSIDFGMNVAEATNAPRFHHQWFAGRTAGRKGLQPRYAKVAGTERAESGAERSDGQHPKYYGWTGR